MSKPIDRVPHQSDYFQDEFLKLIHSDKVYAMLSKLVDDYLVEKINDRVKAYCKKYIRKEMKSIRAGLQHNQAHYTGRNSSVDKASFSRRDQSSGTCRRCKGLRAASNASKNQMLFDERKVQKLERVQSEQRLKQNKISVEGEQMKNKLRKKCIHSPKTDSQANKHKVRLNSLRKQKMLLEQRPPKQEKRKTAESIRQRINRKREKIMQYLNGQDKFFSEKELNQLIKENINLKTKQIINIIKSREQILSPILKVQPEKNFNFSQYSIHVKQQKERQENQHLHLTVMYPNTIEEYQNLSLDDLFHFKKQKKFKNCKDKGKIFLHMMDMFPQDSRTDIYKFIQTNQSLDEDQLIEKWAAKSQKYGIFA